MDTAIARIEARIHLDIITVRAMVEHLEEHPDDEDAIGALHRIHGEIAGLLFALEVLGVKKVAAEILKTTRVPRTSA